MPRTTGGRIGAALVCALAALALLPVPRAGAAQTFVVTSTADSGSDEDNVCSTDCTLRQAVNAANQDGSGERDTIQFNIPGTGPHTINLVQRLSLTNVALDGLTEPGYSVGQPMIVLVVAEPSMSFLLGMSDSLARGLRIVPNPNGVSTLISASSNNVVQSNVIGFASAPTSPPIPGTGVFLQGNDNVIGTDRDGLNDGNEGNVISHLRMGIQVGSGASDNLIAGNRIGTNETGTSALPNVDGIFIHQGSSETTIGGVQQDAGNLVSGNGSSSFTSPGSGITVADGATGVTIKGNRIGTAMNGTTALPNSNGIVVEGDNVVIGGTQPGAANVIAFNRRPTTPGLGEGIQIAASSSSVATGNVMRGNSIYNNGRYDILVGNGPPNDAGDIDEGANGLQNTPTLVAQTNDGSTTTIDGTLQSKPDTSYDIDFFANDSCNQNHPFEREGKSYLGSVTVVTNGSGAAPISAEFPQIPLNPITATATGPEGTSMFSPCLAASLFPFVGDNATYRTAQVGSEFSYQLEIANSGPAPAPASKLTFPLPSGVIVLSATVPQGSCSVDGTVLVCEVGTVAAGTSLDVTVRAVGTKAVDQRKLVTATTDQVFDLSTAVTGIRTEIKGKSCTIVKTAASETFSGTAGDDVLCGLGGNDVIDGRGGNDTIYGGSGADRMSGGNGNDDIAGGAGVDSVTFAMAPRGVEASLADGFASGFGADEITAVENVIGSAFADTLRGSGGRNSIFGGGGADDLFGLAGGDSLFGQGGDDSLNGGGGTDECLQGPGIGSRTGCE